MINKQIQEELSKFRANRESFKIIDTNGLGSMNIMIVWILTKENHDSIVKIIDMTELNENFDVYDYEISLPALIKARKTFLDKENKDLDNLFNKKK